MGIHCVKCYAKSCTRFAALLTWSTKQWNDDDSRAVVWAWYFTVSKSYSGQEWLMRLLSTAGRWPRHAVIPELSKCTALLCGGSWQIIADRSRHVNQSAIGRTQQNQNTIFSWLRYAYTIFISSSAFEWLHDLKILCLSHGYISF